MIFFRKLHKWLGLVIGAQLVIWLLSGTLISFIDQQTVSGAATRRQPAEEVPLASSGPFFPISRLSTPVASAQSVTLASSFAGPVYRVVGNDGTTLYDARTGNIVWIDRPLAEQIASDSYRGAGRLVSSERLETGSNEVRDVPGPVWRINFDDDLATRVYVAVENGEVLAHRNSRWKLVDFLLMLHFMDYVRADSFNNPQIIVVGFGTLWIAISGLLLVFYSFSRSDFLWFPGMRTRHRRVHGMVGSATHATRQVALDGSLSYFAGLSQNEIKLPSNCGGSGSCGLCRIRYVEDPPDHTPVDQEWLDNTALGQGLRLGCQHRPRSGDAIVVPDIAFQQSSQSAEVISSRWLTPLLKEIRIRPDAPVTFTPGDYLEFQVPAFDTQRARMGLPESYWPVWDALSLPGNWSFSHSGTLGRTYSIATAADGARPQELVFTVRFAPPPPGTHLLPGAGSSYMCSLQNGDRVDFRGPAGDFRLIDSDREKILIGGGAGMAPLKAMTLHLLQNLRWQGKLHFWYGARNRKEILYGDTFESLAKEHANFEWQVALSDEGDERHWEGYKGLIHEVVLEQVLKDHGALRECEFYLCGPPPMLAATRQMLRDLGVADQMVRFDDFGN